MGPVRWTMRDLQPVYGTGILSKMPAALGELAHIVGHTDSDDSPRGLDEDPAEAERDSPDNLLLVCDSEHDEIDKRGLRELFSVGLLRRWKSDHEERIRHATEIAHGRTSVVLRMVAMLHGDPVSLDARHAASVVLENGMVPSFDGSWNRHDVEIDLSDVPGEEDADPEYYGSASK